MNHRIRAIADRDPNWAETLRVAFAARDRFEQFMGDARATDAILQEGAAAPCPVFVPTDMDVEDFTRFIKGRVDMFWVPPVVLRRWGVI